MEDLFLDACEQGLTSTILKYIRKSNDVNLTDSNGCTGLMKVFFYLFIFFSTLS
jgi:hypothetical protein